MIKLKITDDFNLDRIADSGQCFRWVKDDSGAYQIIHKGHYLRIRALENQTFALSCSQEEYQNVWHDYFDLGETYQSVRDRVSPKDDAFLAAACEYGKGIRILRQDPWEMLISFIISQNKNIPAIKKSVELLCKAAGQQLETSGQLTETDGQQPEPDGQWQEPDGQRQEPDRQRQENTVNSCYLFPTPEEILSLSDDVLAACRLGYRCRYVKAAAVDVAEGKLDLDRLQDQSEETTIKELMSVCGVGAKVANCVSLFGLHHIDAFPIDVWIRRILENEYPNGYPLDRYSPYNGIYQQYMFYYYRGNYGRKPQGDNK